MKGIAAMAKRSKSGSNKLKVQFSPTLGGPCGDNRRTFVDEALMFTRIRAPLIRVKSWREVSQEVKEDIAEAVMVH